MKKIMAKVVDISITESYKANGQTLVLTTNDLPHLNLLSNYVSDFGRDVPIGYKDC